MNFPESSQAMITDDKTNKDRGFDKQKLSTESRALEPAMRDGSDGLGGASGHRCVIWTASLNRPAIIHYLLQIVDKSTISNPFCV